MTASWQELHRILKHEHSEAAKALEIIPGSNTDGAVDYLMKLPDASNPPSLDPDVDAACREFARSLSWPHNVSIAIKIYVRIQEALDLANFICCHEHPEPTRLRGKNFADREHMLSWLLIDYWYHAGIWHSNYDHDAI